jgi:hypothetical protein
MNLGERRNPEPLHPLLEQNSHAPRERFLHSARSTVATQIKAQRPQ